MHLAPRTGSPFVNLSEGLPALNALLNASAGITVWTAHRVLVQHGDVKRHKRLMVMGVCLSAVFLVSYLAYHYSQPPYAYQGPDWSRWIYFPMLVSHILLAMAIVPMILITLVSGLKSRFDRHKRMARWTYPVWMYVSVTGVLIFLARFL